MIVTNTQSKINVILPQFNFDDSLKHPYNKKVLQPVVMCDITIFITIRYRYDNYDYMLIRYDIDN